MYSHEIQELLRIRNNLVSVREYIEICMSSQVNHVVYKDSKFQVDTEDGYNFVFKINYDII